MTLAKLSNNWFPSTPSLFDRFFNDDLMDWNRFNFSSTDTTLPAVNIKENDKEIRLEVASPGMKKEDFKINYEDGRLTISSEHKNEVEEKEEEKVTRREFSYQSFQRSFVIAEDLINTDKIAASYKDGILNITLPKRKEAKPKPGKEIKIS